MEEIRIYNDYYTRLRDRFRKPARDPKEKPSSADYLLAVPDVFHLMVRLLMSEAVQAQDKLKLTAGIAYFILPFDLLPEALTGTAGFVDDLVVAALILNPILKKYSEEIAGYWAGNYDLYQVFAKIIDQADKWLGSKLFSKLRRKFK